MSAAWRAEQMRFPCPACGAPEGWACTPLRSTGFATVLRPHWQRGKTPWELDVLAKRRAATKRRTPRGSSS